MSTFSLESEDRDGATWLRLAGEFDLSVVAQVEDEMKRLEARDPPLLVLDLSGLTFMDSSGLRIVITTDDRARRGGRRFVVVDGPPVVRRVFEITKVDEVVEIVDDASAVPAV